ncbi:MULTISPECIES: family 78 glycoside hydrolase catalytic domain [Bacteria]|uniref:family 78 glycoside hydrolase catalytic domain n=1 Tax=Bacteria TaxID=2 RepID=UPI003C7BDD05
MRITDLFLPGWGVRDGVDDPSPVLAWKLAAAETGQRQAAYRMRLDPGGIDSGWVQGGAQRWRAPLLAPFTDYRAVLAVRDEHGAEAEENLRFSTGPFSAEDWADAQWITHAAEAAPQLRRVFDAPGGGRAVVHVACAGFAVVSVNGERVSGANDPGFPYYPRGFLSRSYAVDLRPGRNVVTVTLGRGWWGVRSESDWDWRNAAWTDRPRVRIRVTGAATLVSDASWKAAPGRVRYDDVLYGELLDAREETTGWQEAEYDDHAWAEAEEVPAPELPIRAARAYPERPGRLLDPLSEAPSPTGDGTVYDFGLVTTGTARIVVTGPAGTRVEVVHGEKVDASGMVFTANEALHGSGHDLMQTMQTDVLLLSGEEDTFEAQLTFKGCRYVAVLLPENAAEVDVRSVRLREILSETPQRARFTCSDPLLVQLFEMSVRSMLINQHAGVVSDTPTYEKNGWLGDAVAMLESSTLAFDMAPLLRQWHDQALDSFEDLGFLPVIVPPPPRTPEPIGEYFAPEWASAAALFVERVDALHDDPGWVAQSYERVRNVVEWLLANQRRGRWSSCYGDWGSPAGNKRDGGRDSTATAHVVLALKALARMADRVDRAEDAARYGERAAEEAEAWRRRLWDRRTSTYRPSRIYPRMAPFKSTPTLLAYAIGIEPAAHGTAPIDAVARETERLGHLNVGIVGEPLLLPLLHDHGRADLCLALLRSTDRPSWGQWAELGATTTWNGWGEPAQVRSLSHHMHGSYLAYLLTRLAGIRPVSPGAVDLDPSFLVDELDASVDTGRGDVRVAWDADTVRFEVPVGVEARYAGRTLPAGTTTFPRER